MPLDAPILVFVLGMHRSGTSAVTRVLSLCGASLPDHISAPGEDNPAGHWEPRAVRELNDGFLTGRGSAWDDPGLAYRTPPAEPRAFAAYVAAVDRYVADIGAILERDVPDARVTVVKEPRVAILLPFWIAAARRRGFDVRALQIFRNPADVAASLARRNGMGADRAYAVWRKYNLLAERDSRGLPRAFVAYEALMRDWRPEIERALGAIGLDTAIDRGAARAIDAFLSVDLHHHYNARAPGVPAAERRATRLIHEALVRLAQPAEPRELPDALFDTLVHMPETPRVAAQRVAM